MFRAGVLTLSTLAMTLGSMRPEPPETNFFTMSIPLNTGEQQSVVFFTNSYSTKPELLCLEHNSVVDLLAHKLCKDSKFSTSVETSLLLPDAALGYSSDITSSKLSCYQDQYYEISCNRSSSHSSSCSLLQVNCGACYSHISLHPNSSIQLLSPLYPVLQPGLVCQYDLELGQGVAADISLQISDLSLAPAEASSAGAHPHCFNSFLHVLGGASFTELDSVAVLCGELPRHLAVTDSVVVRLILVSGNQDMVQGRRGFLLNIFVSSSKDKFSRQKLWILLFSFFGFIISLIILMCSVLICLTKKKSQERMRQPRRRQTWHGNAARPGQSIHQERTERMRQLGLWGSNNLYMYDNRVGRRLPQIPAFSFSSDRHQAQQEKDEDSGFQVYETISLQSGNADRTIDEAIANTEKKFSSLILQQQHPPPLPSRHTLLPESPYSSPLYLTLPGCYAEPVLHPPVSECPPADAASDSDICAGRGGKHAKQGFSELVGRIRSISMTDYTEDEANLIEGDVEAGEGIGEF